VVDTRGRPRAPGGRGVSAVSVAITDSAGWTAGRVATLGLIGPVVAGTLVGALHVLPETAGISPVSRTSTCSAASEDMPYRAAKSAAVNGACVRAYRSARSPSGSLTGASRASGTPGGRGTPRPSR